MSRTRACINPKPQGQGKDCSVLGNDTEINECGTMPCPGKSCPGKSCPGKSCPAKLATIVNVN